MNFSYNWLQSFFKKKLPKPEKLAELLTMHSFEVGEVKKAGQDFVLDIDVLPNRGPDCFSHLGIAREISAIAGLKHLINSCNLKEDKEIKAKDLIKVQVKEKTACPRYTARVITDTKIGFSPKWMRERLKVCGLKSINNVVDVANYVMLETGQPLHAFDGEKLEGQKIIVRFAREGEKITTLDEEKYDLDKGILVIADARKPVAIAGIKGGKDTGIDLNAKVIVLESANFNPRVTRRGSKRIDLKTDASWRFEHGIDPNLTELAVNRAAFLIQEIAGGKTAQGLVDFYPRKSLPKQIKLDLNYAKSLLGIEIPKAEIIKIFKRLKFKILNSKFNILTIEVPTFRLDVSIPEDLIEEIGRVYGYQKIPAQFPVAALVPRKINLDIFWKDITKDILKEAGFNEVYNYSFIGAEQQWKIKTESSAAISERDRKLFLCKEEELVEVENPTSLDFQYLRPSLIPSLLKNIEKNQRHFGEIKIFELGKIFFKEQKANNKKQIREKRVLTGAITGEAFYRAKGVVDLLLNKLGISNIWYDEYQPTLKRGETERKVRDEAKLQRMPKESKSSIWQPKKCAEIKIDNEKIGFLGEISPKILEDFKIVSKVTVFDIDFEKLARLASEEQEYQPISRFPAAVRDIAVLVPREVRVSQVLNKIYDTGKRLIRDVELFDIYEGEELPVGKKNLAFHIIYQAPDRTLSSEEIDELQKRIIKTLEKKPGWQVRK